MRGFRAHMEDNSSVLRPITTSTKEKYRFCGVFDGHAQSRKVASTLEDLLPRRIGEQKQKSWMTRAGLENACSLADKDILRSEFSDAGSTAIFCVIEKTQSVKVTIGSVGDSQAMIIHSDFSQPPTVPFHNEIHRPQLMESEIDRIKRAGGFVANNRVDGELAVSRAFGDAKYKRNISRKLNEQKVVAIPSVVESIPFKTGDILLLGCDGLFDSMTPAHIDTFIRGTLISVLVKLRKDLNHINHGSVWNISESLAEVAGRLVDEALLRGSRDNMTVMLVQLSPTTSDVDWSDKFSKRYIPPIMFHNAPISFMMMVRDELQSLCLDEDLTLSQCESVIECKSFPSGMSRSQLSLILQLALQRQWENRESWVRLGDFEIPNLIKMSMANSRGRDSWKTFLKFFVCDKTRPVIEEKKNRISSSVISSIHVSGYQGSIMNGTAFIVSSLQETESRKTSADELN